MIPVPGILTRTSAPRYVSKTMRCSPYRQQPTPRGKGTNGLEVPHKRLSHKMKHHAAFKENSVGLCVPMKGYHRVDKVKCKCCRYVCCIHELHHVCFPHAYREIHVYEAQNLIRFTLNCSQLLCLWGGGGRGKWISLATFCIFIAILN